MVTPGGSRFDIQLKGSGITRFSRNGDGRSPLGPVIREYIVSESMHALGIPTTRTLAMVTTGETVRREEIQPSAILTRVASSHIRVGTFEFFAARKDEGAVKQLADYVINRHYPKAAQAQNPYASLYEQVCHAHATGSPMDVRGLHPRCHEYGQHHNFRGNHRLRTMCIHGLL